MLTHASVPPELAPIFSRAQRVVSDYFQTLRAVPDEGTIEVAGERYILVRAAAMSVEFYATITQLYADQGPSEARTVARSLLYDLAHAIGAADARAFHQRLGLRDPIERLSAGPIHFAYTGWAHVRLLPESQFSADESFCLIYDHPYSFEAEAWLGSGRAVDFPTCVMNAGYSAGWCTESFGLPLVAVEICCKAMGDEQCRFVMAPPERIEAAIAAYLAERPALARATASYEIPGFFRRKQAEDALREREQQYRGIFEGVSDAILIVAMDGRIVEANPAAERLYERPDGTLIGLHVSAISAPGSRHLHAEERRRSATPESGEALALAASGRAFEVEFRATPLIYRRQPHVLVVVHDISARKQAEAEQLRLREQLLRQNEQLRAELSLAHSVQAGLLPSEPPWPPSLLTVLRRSLPGGVVSRDFHGYVALDDGRLLVALGDVTGRGVAAALVMALALNALEAQARLTSQPGALLTALQARLAAQLEAVEADVLLLLAVVDPTLGRATLANAGMPQPLLLGPGGPAALEVAGPPLGIGAAARYRELEVALRPGERLLLLSDGVVEARSRYGELFGYARLHAALAAPAHTPEEQIERPLAEIARFAAEAEPHDDRSLLLLLPGGM